MSIITRLGTSTLTIFRCLEQVETLLKTQDHNEQPRQQPDISQKQPMDQLLGPSNLNMAGQDIPQVIPTSMGSTNQEGYTIMDTSGSAEPSNDSAQFSWEMIGLGLEEPLPPGDVINEL